MQQNMPVYLAVLNRMRRIWAYEFMIRMPFVFCSCTRSFSKSGMFVRYSLKTAYNNGNMHKSQLPTEFADRLA